MLKREIQSVFSTNCIAEVAVSKPPYSGSVTRKLAMAPISAIQRTMRAWSSRPRASRMEPNTIGIQMARLKSPIFIVLVPLLPEPFLDHRPADEIRHEHDHAQQHRESVVVDVTRLHPAHHAGEAARQVGAAIDEDAFDHALVAALPQTAANAARRRRYQVLVDPVHVVLVFQQLVERLH